MAILHIGSLLIINHSPTLKIAYNFLKDLTIVSIHVGVGMCVCMQVGSRSEEGIRFYETGVTVVNIWHGFWVLQKNINVFNHGVISSSSCLQYFSHIFKALNQGIQL